MYIVFRTVSYTLLALLPTALGFLWSAGMLALLRVTLDLFSNHGAKVSLVAQQFADRRERGLLDRLRWNKSSVDS